MYDRNIFYTSIGDKIISLPGVTKYSTSISHSAYIQYGKLHINYNNNCHHEDIPNLPIIDNAVDVAVSYYATAYIIDVGSGAGDLYVCGNNNDGRLGVYPPKYIDKPICIAANVNQVTFTRHGMYFTSDRTLFGTNYFKEQTQPMAITINVDYIDSMIGDVYFLKDNQLHHIINYTDGNDEYNMGPADSFKCGQGHVVYSHERNLYIFGFNIFNQQNFTLNCLTKKPILLAEDVDAYTVGPQFTALLKKRKYYAIGILHESSPPNAIYLQSLTIIDKYIIPFKWSPSTHYYAMKIDHKAIITFLIIRRLLYRHIIPRPICFIIFSYLF